MARKLTAIWLGVSNARWLVQLCDHVTSSSTHTADAGVVAAVGKTGLYCFTDLSTSTSQAADTAHFAHPALLITPFTHWPASAWHCQFHDFAKTTQALPYLYLFFGVDDSIVDDFTQRGDHSSGPMRNPEIIGMVMWIWGFRKPQESAEAELSQRFRRHNGRAHYVSPNSHSGYAGA